MFFEVGDFFGFILGGIGCIRVRVYVVFYVDNIIVS